MKRYLIVLLIPLLFGNWTDPIDNLKAKSSKIVEYLQANDSMAIKNEFYSDSFYYYYPDLQEILTEIHGEVKGLKVSDASTFEIGENFETVENPHFPQDLTNIFRVGINLSMKEREDSHFLTLSFVEKGEDDFGLVGIWITKKFFPDLEALAITEEFLNGDYEALKNQIYPQSYIQDSAEAFVNELKRLNAVTKGLEVGLLENISAYDSYSVPQDDKYFTQDTIPLIVASVPMVKFKSATAAEYYAYVTFALDTNAIYQFSGFQIMIPNYPKQQTVDILRYLKNRNIDSLKKTFVSDAYYESLPSKEGAFEYYDKLLNAPGWVTGGIETFEIERQVGNYESVAFTTDSIVFTKVTLPIGSQANLPEGYIQFTFVEIEGEYRLLALNTLQVAEREAQKQLVIFDDININIQDINGVATMYDGGNIYPMKEMENAWNAKDIQAQPQINYIINALNEGTIEQTYRDVNIENLINNKPEHVICLMQHKDGYFWTIIVLVNQDENSKEPLAGKILLRYFKELGVTIDYYMNVKDKDKFIQTVIELNKIKTSTKFDDVINLK